MARIRLDALLVARALSESREQAQRLIRAGVVRVAGQVEGKPGKEFPEDARVEVETPARFVSRGGDKLEGALAHWPVDLAGRVCADIGSSTGGFTDCMLQRGAVKVYAVDVGRGQLHWKLRQDPRVECREEFNARYLAPDAFDPKPDFASVDVSFISLDRILPALVGAMAPRAELVTLIKPQFEAGRGEVGKGGVVRDPAIHQRVIDDVLRFGTTQLGLHSAGVIESPLKGPAGNTEFLAYWLKGPAPPAPDVA